MNFSPEPLIPTHICYVSVSALYLVMFGSKRDLIFYAIAGTIIGWIASLFGANLLVIMFTSLVIPPVILIVIRLINIR